MELTDVQWELLKPLVEPSTPRKRRGRPWRDTRQVVEGVLWILRTGAQWAELPKDKFPPYQTCHRRFQGWVRAGTLVTVLRHSGRGPIGARGIGLSRDLHRCLLQQGEKGGRAVGPTRRGKGTKIMAIADRRGLPLAVGIASASPHETRLVESTVQQRFTTATPRCLIGDRAYDSDPLDAQPATAPRHRTDCAPQVQPQPTENPGRTQAAALLSTLENRTLVCLAP